MAFHIMLIEAWDEEIDRNLVYVGTWNEWDEAVEALSDCFDDAISEITDYDPDNINYVAYDIELDGDRHGDAEAHVFLLDDMRCKYWNWVVFDHDSPCSGTYV